MILHHVEERMVQKGEKYQLHHWGRKERIQINIKNSWK